MLKLPMRTREVFLTAVTIYISVSYYKFIKTVYIEVTVGWAWQPVWECVSAFRRSPTKTCEIHIV